jgi:hypothetical protein
MNLIKYVQENVWNLYTFRHRYVFIVFRLDLFCICDYIGTQRARIV